jgi:hypothetical protein
MAGWLGPALRFIGANGVKYGPMVADWLRSNSEVADQVQTQVRRLRQSSAASPEAMRKTLESMREQVEYLRDSADDGPERARAKAWAASLTRLEHAVRMLSGGSSRADLKRLRAAVDALRGEILDAFLGEQIEDAGGPAPSSGRGGASIEP